jgi:hypothetical protein
MGDRGAARFAGGAGHGPETGAVAAVAAVAAALLSLTWRRWIDPVIDLGRDLYIPEAMAGGARLYEDLLYFYPPLAPSLLAAFVALFGSSLALYTAVGIATAAAAGAALHTLTRITTGRLAAIWALLFFVTLHMTGASTWGANFIFPYAHAATFGMTFFLAFAASLARHLFGARTQASGAAAVAFAVLSAWCKIEYAFAVVVVLAVAVVVYDLALRFAGGFAAGAALAGALFSWRHGGGSEGHHWIRDNVFASSLLSGDSSAFFYSQVSGTAAGWKSIGGLLAGAALVAAAVGLLVAADRALRRRAPVAALAWLFLLVVPFLLLLRGLFFLGWPLLFLLLVPAAVRERGATPLAFLLTVALASSVRIVLSHGPWWYGFVLMIPSYPAILHVLMRWLPARGVYRPRLALAWLALFTTIAAGGAMEGVAKHRAKSYRIDTPRGVWFDFPSRGETVSSLLGWIGSRPAGETMAVLPEGLAINWFAGRETPLSFHTFTPIEVDEPGTEQRIVNELRERPPSIVVLVPRDVREFGYQGLGIDYGHRIMTLLREEYELQWRSPDPAYEAIALVRREAAAIARGGR